MAIFSSFLTSIFEIGKDAHKKANFVRKNIQILVAGIKSRSPISSIRTSSKCLRLNSAKSNQL